MTEWSDWFQHDGKGCPCIGMLVRLRYGDGDVLECIAGSNCRALGIDVNGPLSAWVWQGPAPDEGGVAYYRVRKPRGMEILESILSEVDAPVREVTV